MCVGGDGIDATEPFFRVLAKHLNGRTSGTGSEALLEAHLEGPQKALRDQVFWRLRSSGICMVPVASSSGTRPADESWRWQPPARLSRGSGLGSHLSMPMAVHPERKRSVSRRPH